MRIIKPYGRSIVEAGKLSEREICKTNTEGPLPIAALLAEPELIFAQWLGIIDKIIQKPGEEQEANATQTAEVAEAKNAKSRRARALRQILGRAAWEVMTDATRDHYLKPANAEQAARFKTRWDEKLKTRNAKAKFRNPYPQGRFYKIFLSDAGADTVSPGQMEEFASTIARRIYDYLYQKAFSVDVNGKLKEKSKGASVHRADAVAAATLKRHDNKDRAASKPDFIGEADMMARYKYSRRGDIAARVRNKILAKFERAKSPVYILAVEELRAVWGDVFGAAAPTFAAAQKQNPEMLALHEAVKDFYKRLLKGKPLFPEKLRALLPPGKDAKAKKIELIRQRLEEILPKDMDALLRLMQAKKQNSNINHLIRLGRIIHYQAAENAKKAGESEPALLDDNAAALKNFPSAAELETSRFWTSQGQMEIKQNEAFVRVWRRAIAFAARALKDWADPENKIDGNKTDVLISDGQAQVFANFDEEYNAKKILSLFGMELPSSVSGQEFLRRMLNTVGITRNAIFHFKGLKSFITSLDKEWKIKEKSKDEAQEQYEQRAAQEQSALNALLNFAAQVYAQAQARKYVLLRKDLEAVQIQHYLGQEQIRALWAEITAAEPSILPLPKLKRVLQRAENAWKGEDRLPLPVYLSAQERGKEYGAAANCQYAVLKMLYDKPFKNWLEKLSTERLNGFIDKSIRRSTQSAQKLNGGNKSDPERELIESRAAKLDRLQDGEKLERFFFKLTAKTATEMRVQKGYDSNGEAAAKQAGYIEDLKCDLIAHAFAAYLQEEKQNGRSLAFVLKIDTVKADKKRLFTFSSLEATAPQKAEKWQEKLYLLLHLVPVQEVSSLRQQIRKWGICVGEETANARAGKLEPKQILETLDLYIAMHDAQFSFIESIPGFERENAVKEAESFFADPAGFAKIFPRVNVLKTPENPQGKDENKHLPIRELRELQRFGDAALHELYRAHKISHDAVARWLAAEAGIGEKQQRLMKLHEDWSRAKKQAKKDWEQGQPGKEYAALLAEVAKHRHLTAEVRLQNPLRLHRLLMAVLTRLIDYSGLFERDLYFTLLALLHKSGAEKSTVKKAFTDKGGRFQRGQIPELVGDKDSEGKPYIKDANLLTELKRLFDFDKIKDIRDKFAHLNAMQGNGYVINLTREVNNGRRLMAYDRKLKNAVSKSVIELLEREGLLLEWDCRNHQLENARLKVKQAQHLGGAKILPKMENGKPVLSNKGKPVMLPITEDLHGGAYVEMAAALFDGKAE